MAINPNYGGCSICRDRGDRAPGNIRYSSSEPSGVHQSNISGAKYYAGSGATASFGPTAGCTVAMAAAGAVAADFADKGCWGVTGLPITIDDKKDTVMSACERTNFNFHVCGTLRAVDNNYLLSQPRAFA